MKDIVILAVLLVSLLLCFLIGVLFSIPLLFTIGALTCVLGLNVAICRFVSLKIGSSLPKWLVIATALLPLCISFFVWDVSTLLGILLNRPLGDILVDLSIYLTVYTVFYCTTTVSIFGISSFISALINDFMSQLGTLIGLVLFVGIGLISYLILADSTVLKSYEASGITVSEAESVFAGGSMIFVYILGVAALVSVLWSEISSIFK